MRGARSFTGPMACGGWRMGPCSRIILLGAQFDQQSHGLTLAIRKGTLQLLFVSLSRRISRIAGQSTVLYGPRASTLCPHLATGKLPVICHVSHSNTFRRARNASAALHIARPIGKFHAYPAPVYSVAIKDEASVAQDQAAELCAQILWLVHSARFCACHLDNLWP